MRFSESLMGEGYKTTNNQRGTPRPLFIADIPSCPLPQGESAQ
jgi:hypothetical protein